MILYHGTNIDFEKIDLSLCLPCKDFGRGFYTTTLYNQACQMAKRKVKLSNGMPCVISYYVDDNILFLKDYNIKVFEKATEDWAVFVLNNRNKNFLDISSLNCNLDNKYDIVSGPVANDTLTTIIRRYQQGFIDINMLLKEMKYVAPNNQLSFHTEKALLLLKKVETKWIK